MGLCPSPAGCVGMPGGPEAVPRWLSLLGTAVTSPVRPSSQAKGAWQAQYTSTAWGAPCAGAVPGCGVPLGWGLLLGKSIPCPEALPPPPVSLAPLPGDSLCWSGGYGLVFLWAQWGRAGVPAHPCGSC